MKRGPFYEISLARKTGMTGRTTMKKALILLLMTLAAASALNVQAASVTFEPQKVELKIAPGQTGRTSITAHGYSSTAYSLNFLVGSRLKIGNIPRTWLTAAYLWLDSTAEGTSSCTMNLVISVPPDARPGIYTGLLEPDDMRSSEPIKSPGISIAIEVPEP